MLLRTNSNHPLFLELATLLNQELNTRYGEIQAGYDQYNSFSDPVDVMLLLDDNNQAVACGALRALGHNNWVEMKRVFVPPVYRGQGNSKRVVTALEAWAAEQGFNAVVLETGKRLFEAVKLYKNMGYQIIDNYPPYEDLPHSICMKKDLKTI